tara:strand:+ start:32951 stop:33136 length:186 start_codon:yes stop_codon:yes gene_type:complete
MKLVGIWLHGTESEQLGAHRKTIGQAHWSVRIRGLISVDQRHIAQRHSSFKAVEMPVCGRL